MYIIYYSSTLIQCSVHLPKRTLLHEIQKFLTAQFCEILVKLFYGYN